MSSDHKIGRKQTGTDTDTVNRHVADWQQATNARQEESEIARHQEALERETKRGLLRIRLKDFSSFVSFAKSQVAASAAPNNASRVTSRGRRNLWCAVPCLLSAIPVMATAGEATGVFHVSLIIVAGCSVSTKPITFAPYTTGGAATGTGVPGSIDVTCSRGTPAAVYLEGSQVLDNGRGSRIAYALQADGRPWPPGVPLHITGQGKSVHVAISGTVAGGQSAPPGEYANDQIVRVVY